MASKESLRLIGAICVQNRLPAGDPCWIAEHIGNFATDEGDFSFIVDKTSKTCLYSGYKAVAEVNGWEYLKTFDPPNGFAFCEPTDELRRINSAISKHYDGHSGSSYNWTMRCMQFIAKNGWYAFKVRMTKTE